MKAPSTKATGTVLTLAAALVLVGAMLMAASTPVTARVVASSLPTDAAPSMPAAQSSASDAFDLGREAAVHVPDRVPASSPEGQLPAAETEWPCWEVWCELSVALDQLMDASEAMRAATGTEIGFRDRQREYVEAAAQLDGWRDRLEVVPPEPSRGSDHPLQRHASDPPDAVVFAFRRHFLDAFHALPLPIRRSLLGDEITPREQAVTSRIDPDAGWLFRRSLEARFRPLRNCWLLVER